MLTNVKASNLLAKDRIRQGRQLLFAGHSRFYQTVCLVLPLLFVLHMVVVLFATRKHFGTYFDVRITDASGTDIRMLLLGISLRGMALVALCSLSLVVLNLSTPDIFACSLDPLVKASMAPVKVSYSYQWVFVVLNGAMMMATARPPS